MFKFRQLQKFGQHARLPSVEKYWVFWRDNMKYDLNKKPTRGAVRTLDAFAQTMFSLLQEKPFEDISVNEISNVSNFPRATFYNYFDDKYDLANYCWYVLSQEIHLEEYLKFSPDELIDVYFDRLFDLLSEKEELLDGIKKYNSMDGLLINSFLNYFKDLVRKIAEEFSNNYDNDVPPELVADHYCNTILLVLEWIFLRNNPVDKAKAHKYLSSLLNNNQLREKNVKE